MKKVIEKILFVSFFIMGSSAIAQSLLTTATITSEKSAHINSGIDVNYDITTLEVGTYLRLGVQTYRRAFVEFDIAAENIPIGAIIYSATLDITHNGTVYGSNPWNAKLVKTSWGETTVKASNQPVISGLSGDISSTYTTSGNTVKIDVTSMVQRMNYEQISNFGWSIQVNNEGYSGRTGAVFYSDDHGTTSLCPKLVIKYYIPLTITAAAIVHESATGAGDGSISFSYTNGGSTNYLYSWYDGAGNTLPGGASTNNLEAGWYGVKMVGDDGIVETFYYAFLVGTECEEVTIEFEATSGNNFNKYMDNAFCSNFNNGTFDATSVNSGENLNFQSSRENIGVVFSSNSYLRFNLWMDDAFTVNQSDLILQGKDHSGTANDAEFNIVTEPWNEFLIAWSQQPTSISGPTVNVPQTGSSTEDKTADLIDFWEDWKFDNTTNHGMLFQLQSFASFPNKQHFHSPTAAAIADKPKITFRLSLENLDNLLFCNPEANPYVELKRTLDAGYAIAYEGNLKFAFQEAYDIDPLEFWSLKLFNSDHIKIASCDASGTTAGGMTSQSYSFDDNRFTIDLSTITSTTAGEFYLLEVTTQKGDRHYLKVLYQD